MTDDAKRLGYGGTAEIESGEDSVQLLITSGSMNTDKSPSYLDYFDIPADDDPAENRRSRVLHADGISSYAGDISFDVTEAFLNILTKDKLLARRYKFDLSMHDGEKAKRMSDCYASSVSLNGSAGGLITGSISFSSANSPVKLSDSEADIINSFISTYIEEDTDQNPLGYWSSGNTNVRDWSFTMNQVVNPMYGNIGLQSPTLPPTGNESAIGMQSPNYLLVGLVDYSLSVTTYEDIYEHTEINIYTKSFTLTGVTNSTGYSYGGSSDLGSYTHEFVTAADATVGSDGVIIN